MTGKPIEFHPEAIAEAEAAVIWYRERSLRAAEALVNEIEHALRAISETPQRWSVFEAGTRRMSLRRFPYSIIYREKTEAIEVLAVAHGRRRPGYWRRRDA